MGADTAPLPAPLSCLEPRQAARLPRPSFQVPPRGWATGAPRPEAAQAGGALMPRPHWTLALRASRPGFAAGPPGMWGLGETWEQCPVPQWGSFCSWPWEGRVLGGWGLAWG